MGSLMIVVNEQIENRRMIWNLTNYESKNRYAGNALGSIWVFLNPFIQICIFWFAFGVGLRGGSPVGEIPFLIWLLTGLMPWFYISACINQGATSISSKLSLASKVSFPLSIVPIYVIFSQLQTHLILLSLIFFLMIVFGVGFAGLSILGLLYFIFATTVFLIALSFVTSTLISIVKDLRLLIEHIVRLIFWTTPIMWQVGNTSFWYGLVLRANPVYYLVIGYRNSFLYADVTSIPLIDTIYFWSLTAFMLILGTRIHVKFRREFIDYL